MFRFFVARPTRPTGLTYLGTDYGGWAVTDPEDLSGSLCYLFGIGEDASFDTELAGTYGATVYSFDPTPRSLEYMARQSLPAQLEVVPWAIWTTDGAIEMFVPRNAAHVSHSITNIGGTEASISVEARTLDSIAQELGHDLAELRLLKLDIEGAEIEVLHDLLNSSTRPGVLCFEIDQPQSLRSSAEVVRRLKAAGYECISMNRWDITMAWRGP